MQPLLQEISAYFNDQINQGLAAQWRRMQGHWEPAAIEALGAAADQGLAGLEQALGQAPDAAAALTPALRFLHGGLPALAHEATMAAKAILLEMVVSEAPRLAEAITQGGLLAPTPDWDLTRLGRHDLLERFAGGQALKQAVIKNLAGVIPRLQALLEQAAHAGQPLPQLRQGLAALFQGWRGQLGTLARTVLYAAADRIKEAVLASVA